MFNQDYQTLLPISSSSQDIFQTRNRMTLTIRKHFGILLFSHTTLFSSRSSEKHFPSTFPNRLLDTSGLSAQVRLTVLENKPMHFSTSWFLAPGDTFVFPLSFILTYLIISKRIMAQLPTYWYRTEAFWVGGCINILCFKPFHIFSSQITLHGDWNQN